MIFSKFPWIWGDYRHLPAIHQGFFHPLKHPLSSYSAAWRCRPFPKWGTSTTTMRMGGACGVWPARLICVNHMGVSINGASQNGWFISWKIPIYKWMMTGGTPISGNHHINTNYLSIAQNHIKGVRVIAVWSLYSMIVLGVLVVVEREIKRCSNWFK